MNPNTTPTIIDVLKEAVSLRPYSMFRCAYGIKRIRVIIVSMGATNITNHPVATATLPLLGGPGQGRPKTITIP